ncbi:MULTISPECIES: DUF1266 domain-containing protein [unclassified Streptomyces]|uniref:DUF1266 domain-containing protein n=1 Tax=unclassified Streptomyces TaxID=2593676 RepID=UPI00224F38E1|nr:MULTISPECIES: DUF1266 domain-containing protein [unclassified Streptomyces]MCX4880669.1 DUF1266 domain-containing protein [Streptomyces sp. NBC_00847]MCX5420660.1 DUF1266 domain-containing protein [Streptomyces sp. NBC_00078]
MVSLSAPVSRDRNASRTTLYPYTRIDDDSARGWLADQWEITSRERLVGRLDELSRGGYRARAQQVLGVSPLAWDAALYVDIARLGFGCGMVTEAEAWTALKNIVPSVVRTYGSWREYADHYLLGRKVWRDGLSGSPDAAFPAPQAAADAHLSALLDPANRSSPWNLAPWDTISRPDRAR